MSNHLKIDSGRPEINKNYTVCRRHHGTGARSRCRLQLLKLLHNFKNISGLEVNKHKTEAMWLGSWRNRTKKPFGFKWPHNSIYTLGVHFSYDPVLANKLNFEEKV